VICVSKDTVYSFINDVVRDISAMVPTPYFHMGGDEVEKLTHDQYLRFVERVQGIITANGKQMIGWGEIATANLTPNTIVQNWRRDSAAVHVARGGKVIMSPSAKTYIDMKYDSTTVLGLHWAGLIEVRDAYDWDPATLLQGIGEPSLLGRSATLVRDARQSRTMSSWRSRAWPRWRRWGGRRRVRATGRRSACDSPIRGRG
jgi:hexosaminidase